MHLLRSALLCGLFLCFALFAHADNEGNEYVVTVRVEGQKTVDKLYRLGLSSLEPSKDFSSVEVYVSEDQLSLLENFDVVEKQINPSQAVHEREVINRNKRTVPADGIAQYHNYNDLTDLLASLEAQYPTILKKFTIGKSIGGREIWGVKISKNVGM